MKITKETEVNPDDDISELYSFPEDELLKVTLQEQEQDLLEDLSFLPEKIRKILEKIENSKTVPSED